MRCSLLFLTVFISPLPLLILAQEADIICDDNNLTTYLLSLIDHLYSNGLTIFEQLIAHVSESDEGYTLLDGWSQSSQSQSSQITLFAPTDTAFQQTAYLPPFSSTGPDILAELLALHSVDGQWTWDQLAPSPQKSVGNSQLKIEDYMNSTSSSSSATFPVVFQQGDNGAMTLRLVSGNATTWGWSIDTSNSPVQNIILIPIDTVLQFPPKLSKALTLPTTSRSPQGLPQLVQALESTGGMANLETLTDKGFTFFAPVDDAFSDNVKKAMADKTIAAEILGNHYATNNTLFSPSWNNGTVSLPVDSESTLILSTDIDGAYVALGDIKAKILRSDIVLENGVLHLIDRVLATSDSLGGSNDTASSNSSTPFKSSAPTVISSGRINSAQITSTVPSGTDDGNGTVVVQKVEGDGTLAVNRYTNAQICCVVMLAFSAPTILSL